MSLSDKDLRYIWHPLTQHKTAKAAIPIVKAEGAVLTDENGKEYIDAISSWYTAVYGHCNPVVIEAVTRQMQQLDHVVFSGFTHEPAIQLSERLLQILPENQKKIFFNDNGSTAVEAAIKMALQYHSNRGMKRDTIIALEDGFHGDTFGAMSVSGLSVYNGPFEEHFLKVVRLTPPQEDSSELVLDQLKKLIASNDCAAFIYEPVLQGAAGMKLYSATAMDDLLKFCKARDVLCIADEVMTGFGKTGKNFASEYVNTLPDIICLSKALTAGMLPMGITSCTEEVFTAFLDEHPAKGFFHAHTYSANPPACAAAIAGLDLLASEEIQQNIRRISQSHLEYAGTLSGNELISEIRTLGVVLAIDLKAETERYGALRDKLFEHCMSRGVYLRPLGNTIYIVPPYIISEKQLEKVYDTLNSVFELL